MSLAGIMLSLIEMLDIQRILCPIDLSDASRHALTHAVTIERRYGSRISVLHVGNPMIVLTDSVQVAESAGDVLPGKTNRQLLEDDVREWLAPATSARLRTDVIIDEGNPAPCILAHAQSLPADLIVMGTQDRERIAR